MKVYVIQSGSYLEDGNLKYSITSHRQVESLTNLGLELKVGIVTNRTSPSKIYENIRRLRKEVDQFQPDLIHAHYGSMVGYVARKVARKIPLVISFCGDDLLGTPNPGISWRLREKIAHFLSLNTAYKAKKIIIKSDNLLEALPLKVRNKVNIVPNGVNIDFFSPEDQEKCRSKLNWGDEPVIFFNQSSGTNIEVKNIDLAIETQTILVKIYPNIRLEVINNDSPETLRTKMCASNCVLVTSLHEGSPNIVKEAMACNIPVVSVDCGDVKVRLKESNLGGVFAYKPEQLAKSIEEVLESDLDYNGRANLIQQGLDSVSSAKKIQETYIGALQV